MLGTTLLPLPRCHYPFTTAAILRKTWRMKSPESEKKEHNVLATPRCAAHPGPSPCWTARCCLQNGFGTARSRTTALIFSKITVAAPKKGESLNIFWKGKNIFWKTVRTAHLLLQQDCYWIQKTRGSLQGGVYVLPRRNYRVFRLQNRSGRCSTQCLLSA